MKFYYSYLGAVLSAATLLSGCGNVFPGPVPKGSASSNFYYNSNQSSAASSDASNSGEKANYNCTGQGTIRQEYSDVTFTPNMISYEACPNLDTSITQKVILSGDFSVSDTLCVFPAKQSANGAISWYADASKNGAPLYLCSKEVDQLGFAIYDFPTLQGVTGFNAAFVVDPVDTAQMVTCLKYQLNGCPEYYYGKFR